MTRALVIALLVAGCDEVPARFTLESPDLVLEVTSRPYSLLLRDGTGREVLRSAPKSSPGRTPGDGWGPLGWATGRLEWAVIAIPGYTQFDAILDKWRDQPEVRSAREKPGELEVTLSDGTRVRHIAAPGRLRVEASRADQEKPRAWEAGFASPADEGFLGFGQRYNRVDQRGISLYTWHEEGGLSEGEAVKAGPTNPWPNGEGMTWYAVPFFISSRGYAFWLDSTWRNHFDMATEGREAWRVWDIGPTLAYEVFLPRTSDARPWPLQVIDAFTARTGRPMIPPDWAFGPRRRIGRGAYINGVHEVQLMRQEGLALTAVDDAQHFLPNADDIPFHAELAAWVRQNDAAGVRTNGYYNPYFSSDPEEPIAPETQRGLANGWFLKDAAGKPSEVWLISGRPVNVYTVDFTQPAATSFFISHFRRALDLGYAGWMYDFGEYVLPDVLTASKISGEEYHNRFPVEYTKAAHDALEAERPGDWFFFARSGYTGSQMYTPMVWSGDPDASFGDAEGLPAHVRGGINLSASGVAHWGSDIGGFKCLKPDGAELANGELLARWIEFGAVSANMQDQNACSGGQRDLKANLWNAPEAKEAWRIWAKLHTRLQPYLSSLARQANNTGAPVMRALFLEHPDQRELFAVDDTFYFGPAILAAPVVERGARQRTVQLPDGVYLDWRAQRLVQGQITVEAPIEVLPLFLRDGRIVPLLDASIETLDARPHTGVVGPNEVADVYDVVGLITRATGQARFTLADGSALAVDWAGGAVTPPLAPATSEVELASCAGCWRKETLEGGLLRVRLSATGDLSAGGLTLGSSTGRRVRWDLYLAE